jgi:hypothetical protein
MVRRATELLFDVSGKSAVGEIFNLEPSRPARHACVVKLAAFGLITYFFFY